MHACSFIATYPHMSIALFPCRVPPIAHAIKAFENWRVAFHGTASKNVMKDIGDRLLIITWSA